MKIERELPLNTEPRSSRPEPPFTFAQTMAVDRRVTRQERRLDKLLIVGVLFLVVGVVAFLFGAAVI